MASTRAADIADDLELLRSCAVAAGIVACGYFRAEVKTWTKANASPVTEADYMVDRYLRQMLGNARPEYGWLSEESADDPARLESERLFIVDPIDGTRAFLRGEDCWTISLAVVANGTPLAGVVYAPARDELYAAGRGTGAFLNGTRLSGLGRPPGAPLIPAPGAVHRELRAAGVDYVRGPYFSSLAYRLVQVAAGRIDATAARRGASDWDIAAATIILSEAGARLEDVCRGSVRLNARVPRHCALAAFSDSRLQPVLNDALRRVYGCPPDLVDEQNLEQHRR